MSKRRVKLVQEIVQKNRIGSESVRNVVEIESDVEDIEELEHRAMSLLCSMNQFPTMALCKGTDK